MQWILERMKEPSTWVGVISMLSMVISYEFTPEMQSLVTTAGVTISSIVLIIIRERKS